MNSRYLALLNTKLAQSHESRQKNYLTADRAAYLARLGDISSSRRDIDLLRMEGTISSDGRLAALVNFADGLCHYYQDMSGESRDRLSRSYALAIATANDDVASRAAAWLALIAYGKYEFSLMSRHLAASSECRVSDPVSNARNALTLALATHLANRFDLARTWYQRAHRSAAEVEDDAMISAILHNMSSILVTNIRNSILGPIATNDKPGLALAGISSTVNFDEILGSTSQPVFTPLTKAQLLSLEGRYQDALVLYEQSMREIRISGSNGWQAWLTADWAWCLLKTGDIERARTQFDCASSMLEDHDHIDDRAAALKRISAGYSEVGDEARSVEFGVRADDHWQAFRGLQAEMLKAASAYSP